MGSFQLDSDVVVFCLEPKPFDRVDSAAPVVSVAEAWGLGCQLQYSQPFDTATAVKMQLPMAIFPSVHLLQDSYQ
jgi:hypothetical protein